MKVASYRWRHWLTTEKKEFMFTLHNPVRTHSIEKERLLVILVVIFRNWPCSVVLDDSELWRDGTWRNGTKQCSLFRDTITTDCSLSVDFIPCCFCYTSLLNFLHINILLLVYLWCMKIFWLTDGMLHVNGIFFLIKRFAKEMENRKRDIQILFPFQLHMTLLRQAYCIWFSKNCIRR